MYRWPAELKIAARLLWNGPAMCWQAAVAAWADGRAAINVARVSRLTRATSTAAVRAWNEPRGPLSLLFKGGSSPAVPGGGLPGAVPGPRPGRRRYARSRHV